MTTQLVIYWILLISKKIADNKQQQTNFIGKLKNQANRAKAFFIIEKSEETTFEFLQNSVNIL